MKALLVALVITVSLVGIQQWRIDRLQGENDRLSAAIETQNNAVENMKTAGQLETSQAENRVNDVLDQGEQLKRSLPKGTGPKAMNQFMQAVFP